MCDIANPGQSKYEGKDFYQGGPVIPGAQLQRALRQKGRFGVREPKGRADVREIKTEPRGGGGGKVRSGG